MSSNYSFFSKDPIPAVCNNSWCVMFALLTTILALIFACIEIEIEGPCGWADKLPTPSTGSNPKSLTIYHYLIFFLMFFVFSSVFFINPRRFNIANIGFIFAYTLIFIVHEDFYWFCLNPYYNMDTTNVKTGKKAWWHSNLGNIPVLYMALPLLAFGICLLSGYSITFLKSSVIFITCTLIIMAISPAYHKFYLAKHKDNKDFKCNKQ